ncbi:MAG: hypothetical protein HUJ58_01800 [Erysipelotrichaceae bacterium]|nr:hypothetical protein [Erysipelotrichaceae bacterium]
MKKTSDILDELVGTYLAIEDLNNKVPEIKRLYDTVQNELRTLKEESKGNLDLCTEVKSEITDTREENKSLADDVKQYHDGTSALFDRSASLITSALEEIKTRQSDLDEKLKKLPDVKKLSKTIEELIERVDTLEGYYDSKIEELEETIAMLKENQQHFEVEEEYEITDEMMDSEEAEEPDDEDQLHSIAELLEMYDQEEIIFVRDKWHGDFCFLVEKYDDTSAYGTQYQNGNPYRSNVKFGIHRKEFRVYNGRSKEKILKSVELIDEE